MNHTHTIQQHSNLFLSQKMSAATQVANQVARHGYSLITASDYRAFFQNSHTNSNDLRQIQDSFENLPVDTFMQDGGKYRKRRFGTFLTNSITLAVTTAENAAFFQSKEVNTVNGGKPRHFEPLEKHIAESKLLHQLISFHLKNLPKRFHAKYWKVFLHQIRIESRAGSAGKPVPEGVHRDGHEYVAQIMMNKSNMWGGISQIYSAQHVMLEQLCLESPLDTILIDDQRMLHNVTQTFVKSSRHLGTRDMILIDFNRCLDGRHE